MSHQNPGYHPVEGYPPPNAPVMTQPGGIPAPPGVQVIALQRPETIPGCPPGLEYLTQVDQVLMHQSVNLLEAFVGIECQCSFEVKNAAGQKIYQAGEESGFCTRQCCGSQRGFVMHVADNFGSEVLRAHREFKLCACCAWCACSDCCAHLIAVEAPVGSVIGYVRQSCSVIKPCFEIQSADRQPLLKLEGPWCICECPCCDVNFELFTMDDKKVGKVMKQWTGAVKELFTEADNFGITFPMDLDVNVKATLVAAVFLINMMFFERNQEKRD